MHTREWLNKVLCLGLACAVAVSACGDDGENALAPQNVAGESGSGNTAGQRVDPAKGGSSGRAANELGGSGTVAGGGASDGDGATAGVPTSAGTAGTDSGAAGAGAGAAGSAGAGADAEIDPCATIDPAVRAHVQEMRTQGWQARNAANVLQMYGCAGATTARNCLATYPLALDTAYGAGWQNDTPHSALRVLRVNAYSSKYGTAVSADGRFVAHGGKGTANGSSTIIDLQKSELIGAAAQYDPNFLPDNAGFMLQGGDGKICPVSLLTSGATSVLFSEPGCSRLNGVGLYNHLGALLDGTDYLSAHGSFQADDGGHQATLENPSASFSASATATLVPFQSNGVSFVQKVPVIVPTPMEGDFTISASGRLLLSRVQGAGTAQDGYNLRRVTLTPSGNTYTAEAPPVAHYCGIGGIPAFSYDERYVAYHHYTTSADALELGFSGAADPGFAEYLTKGASDLYLMDLLTGVSWRITRMAPGQYALFPSFRSDGWLYFLVRVAGTTTEYVVASDAALTAAER